MDGEAVTLPPPATNDVGRNEKIMTVAIYYPPLIPSVSTEDWSGSRIQDDEVSSTIEPSGGGISDENLEEEKGNNDPLKTNVTSDLELGLTAPLSKNDVTVHITVPKVDLTTINRENSEENQSQSLEEYSESQSPSTSQPSPPEPPKPDMEECLKITSAPLPGIVGVSDNIQSQQKQNQTLDKEVECSPNLLIDDDDYEDAKTQTEDDGPTKKNEKTQIEITPTKPKPELLAISPKAVHAEKKAYHVPDLCSPLPFKHCRIILTRCDQEQKDTKGWFRTENKFAFYDQITDKDVEKSKKLRDRAAKRKQEIQATPPEKPLKVERRGRPPKLKKADDVSHLKHPINPQRRDEPLKKADDAGHQKNSMKTERRGRPPKRSGEPLKKADDAGGEKTSMKVERRGRPPKCLGEPLKKADDVTNLKNPIKVERRGRPRKPTTGADIASIDKSGHRRRKRRGMAGMVRYSRYNKKLQKMKAKKSPCNALLDGSGEAHKTDHMIRLKTPPFVNEDIASIEEEISMMDTCPSPNISDSESCADEVHSDETSINIITAEDARKFVTAWVNTGEDESSNAFQNSQSKTQTSTMPQSSPSPVPLSLASDEEEEELEVPDEVEMKPLLKCSTCLKTFDNPMTLQVHMRLHTGERPYKCKCCEEAFIHYTYLDYHYKNTHGHGESNSPKKTERKQKHVQKGNQKTGNALSNKNCRIAFFPRKTVLPSQQPPPTPKRKVVSSSSKFKKLKTTKIPQHPSAPESGSYICPYCKLRFQHASLLITHLKRHSGDHPFSCSHCGQGFKQSRNLDKHVKQAHAISKLLLSNHGEEIPEDDLDDNASVVSNLTTRRLQFKKSGFNKKPNGISSGNDQKCKKNLIESEDLFIKVRRHRCHYCGKKFPSPDNLKTHIRIHTLERPYQCTHCPAKFTQKVHMEKHVRLIHSENSHKKYTCVECRGGFQSKGNLDRHMVLAHGHGVTSSSSNPPSPIRAPAVTVVAKSLKTRKKKKKQYSSKKCNYSLTRATVAPSMTKNAKLPKELPKRDLRGSHVRLTRCDELVAQLMERRRESESGMLPGKKSLDTSRSQEPSHYAVKSKPSHANSKSNNIKQRSVPPFKTASQIKPTGSDHEEETISQDKSFPCQFCKKRFASYNTRYVHLRIHTGVKPYKCSICHGEFRQKNTLNIHMRTHAKKNEFPSNVSRT